MAFVYTSVTSDQGSAARLSLSAVDTAAGAGFPELHRTQLGQAGFEPLPNPAGDILAGWIFQACDVVEIVVVQLIVEGLEGGLEVTEVHDPAGGLRCITAH